MLDIIEIRLCCWPASLQTGKPAGQQAGKRGSRKVKESSVASSLYDFITEQALDLISTLKQK